MTSTDPDTQTPTSAEPRNSFLEEKAFRSRTVLIFGPISDALAGDVARRLIALDADAASTIDMFVSSPGGHLESGETVGYRPAKRSITAWWVG